MAYIIIDSSVWIHAFRAMDSTERQEVERLVRGRQAATVGIVYAEILRGARSEEEFRSLADRLDGLPYLEANKEAWQQAGRLLFELRRQGQIIPLADALIAALALEGDHQVYSLDDHFQRVPGLRVYRGKGV